MIKQTLVQRTQALPLNFDVCLTALAATASGRKLPPGGLVHKVVHLFFVQRQLVADHVEGERLEAE